MGEKIKMKNNLNQGKSNWERFYQQLRNKNQIQG